MLKIPHSSCERIDAVRFACEVEGPVNVWEYGRRRYLASNAFDAIIKGDTER